MVPTAERRGAVLVGGGLAAITAARSLRASGWDRPIVLVSAEPGAPYDRPPLSKQYLTGQVRADEIELLRSDELAELEVRLLAGRRAVAVDPARRTVTLDDRTRLDYQTLLLATGAAARRLTDPGFPGVHYLRTLSDADSLARALRRGGRLVVIGAGFVGLEVAASARSLGLAVAVLESAPGPLTRVLGADAGALIAGLHRARGVELHFGMQELDLVPAHGTILARWRTQDGPDGVTADMVVAGIGAEPRVGWLSGSGIEVDDGVVCDAGGRTSSAGVYAAGDVSRWHNALTGSTHRMEQWQAALEQGSIAGANMAADCGIAGASERQWSSVPYFWSDQYEHKVQFCGSAGPISRSASTARGAVTCYAPAADGQLSGVLSVDSPAALAAGRRLVAQGASWAEARTWLTKQDSGGLVPCIT
jgi:3-phenylpropionate/trans-cinnamate dioxygenase ferredoxin reductase component